MKLSIPIIHHPKIHGYSNEKYNGHFINYDDVSMEEFHDLGPTKDWLKFLNKKMKEQKKVYESYEHPIRNYWKLSETPKIELVETVILEDTNEEICLIKTYIIKRIQRRWRNYIKNKNK